MDTSTNGLVRPDTTGIVDDPLSLVGWTPLVAISAAVGAPACRVAAKLEWFNPGGSVKDRAAVAMVEDAAARGLLGAGAVIVEPTSGNTGAALAMIAARRGYRCVFTVPDKVAPQKLALLRAYGAEVITCPTNVEPDDPRSYYSVAARIAEVTPGAWTPNQYHNPANADAHEDGTGPEIWQQTGGRVTHFVAGAGTGGTVSGVARFLKSQNPEIQVIVADPEGSVYSGGPVHPYLVEGVGEDFWPSNYDREVIDDVIAVSDAASFAAARRMSRSEGILVGGSSGTALAAAGVVARDLPSDALVVVLLPDSGHNYLARFHDDSWMTDHGFDADRRRHGHVDVATAVDASRATLPALVHADADHTVAEALERMRTFEVSQLPVFSSGEDVAALVGSVHAADLEAIIADAPAAGSVAVGEVMTGRFPVVHVGAPVEVVIELDGPVVVAEAGHAVGVLTPADVYGLVRA